MAHRVIRCAVAKCVRGPMFVPQPDNAGCQSLTRSLRHPRPRPSPALLFTTASMLQDERDGMSPPTHLHPSPSHPNMTLPDHEKDHEYLRIDADLSPTNFKPDSPWGLAVYRTCYDDEAAWQKLIALLTDVGEPSSWPVDGQYMPGRHQLAIMDDRALFEGAERVTIRDHFAQWARAEMKRNMAERKDADPQNRFYPPDHLGQYGPRYNMFGIIDDVCIESIYREKPLIMLVRRDWKPMTEEETRAAYYGDIHEDFEDGWMVDHTEGPGGWIYTKIFDYVYYYGHLEDINDWVYDHMFLYPSSVYGEEYRCGRPVLGMGLERSPGFWREEMAVKKKATSTQE